MLLSVPSIRSVTTSIIEYTPLDNYLILMSSSIWSSTTSIYYEIHLIGGQILTDHGSFFT